MSNESTPVSGFEYLFVGILGLGGISVLCGVSYGVYYFITEKPLESWWNNLNRPSSTLSATPTSPWVETTATPYPQQDTQILDVPESAPEKPKKEKPEKPEVGTCITIDSEHLTAYSAWKQLGGPDEVKFKNVAGPDATGKSNKINAPGGLPRLVHPGDEICHITNRNGFSPRLTGPALGSHPGWGTR